MTVPPISEASIRHHSTANSFSRGEAYYQQGSVTDIVQRGNTIQAEVEGSEVNPYRVTLQFDSGGITSARCTCPYDYEGWCKHIVAAALAWVQQPDQVEVRPPIEQLLDRLNPIQMRQLLQDLLNQHPDLVDEVDRQVLIMTNPAPPQKVATGRRTTLDTAPFRRQVKHLLREGLRALEEDYDDDPFTDRLSEVVEKAQTFSRSGDGNSAIAILEAITTACVDEWDDLVDYGGDDFEIVELLNEAWTEAILSAELSQPEHVDLLVMLEKWQDSLSGDFRMSLAALQQGWQDPQLQRALHGQNYSDPAWLEAPFAQDLALIRLQILDRQERQQEYLNLARAEGLMLPYLTRLAELGNVEVAMATARERMSTAEEAFALAKTLREYNHLSEALAIAEAGLPLPGNCRYDLASWTSEFAEGLGKRDMAREASTLAFTLRPSFSDYRRVEQLAANQWSQVKPELLQVLRNRQTWDAEKAKVDIFLHEGLIEDAIQAVRSDNYYRSELVLRVMQAAVPHRPDWVIEAARQRAEPIIEQGKADRYQEAVNWLKQAKAAYLQSGQKSAWQTYFSHLQVAHARKRKLIDLFKQLY